jgi:hypothetical protein
MSFGECVEGGFEQFLLKPWCEVVFTAGAKPQVFDGGIRCELSPVEPSAVAVAAAEEAAAAEAVREVIIAQQGDRAQPSMPSVSSNGGAGVFASFSGKQRVSVVHAATMSSAARHPDLAAAGSAEHQRSLPHPAVPLGPVTLALGVEGRVAPEVQFREEHGAELYDRFFIPSFRPAAPATQQAHLAIEDAATVISSLLHDMLGDPAVRRGFDSLVEEAMPYFVQMRKGRAGTAAETDAAAAAAAAHFTGTDDQRAAAIKIQAIQRGKADRARVEALKAEKEAAPDAATAEAKAAQTTEAEELAEDFVEDPLTVRAAAAEVAAAQANPEFRELAEWALEATLYNLIKELHATHQEMADEEEYF